MESPEKIQLQRYHEKQKWGKWHIAANLIGDGEGRVFVSRSNDDGVLASSLNQILDPDEEPDLVVLELTQAANQFKFEEFAFDHQATEITFPFHNIIRRSYISLERIKFECYIQMPLLDLGRISNQADTVLPSSAIFKETLDIVYETPIRTQYEL
ncbi:hypothetical protein ABIB62_004385 [Mucilaginibacter sp. UYP25]|uniref:hypothetical protein n=1 Tax=unclassified Mucilaginibacter TaxID=2617802 RepID=UPI00339534B8